MLLQASLIFVSKTGGYPSEALYRVPLYGYAPRLEFTKLLKSLFEYRFLSTRVTQALKPCSLSLRHPCLQNYHKIVVTTCKCHPKGLYYKTYAFVIYEKWTHYVAS